MRSFEPVFMRWFALASPKNYFTSKQPVRFENSLQTGCLDFILEFAVWLKSIR
jgi:hypothetical protein